MRESRNNVSLWFIFGFFILVIVGITGYILFQRMLNSNNISITASSSMENKPKDKFILGNFTNLQDTPYLMAPIYLKGKDRSYDYDGKTIAGSRNFLFINVNDKSSRRLVENNDFLFIRNEQVSNNPKNALKQNDLNSAQGNPGLVNNVQALWYEVITNDSNGNKVLDYEDKKNIAFSEPSGGNYREIIKEVDAILGTYQKDNKTMLFLYSSNGKSFVTEVNFLNRQVIETKELPSIQ